MKKIFVLMFALIPMLFILNSCSTPQEKAALKLKNIGYELTNNDLFKAIKSKDIPAIKLFIESDYNINFVDSDKISPLIMACQNNNYEIAKILIEAGANIDHFTTNKDTPLMIATEKGNIKIVDLLLKNNANAELYNKDGWSPIMKASYNNKINLVKNLMRFSTNKQIDDSLLLSSKKGNIEICNLLLSNGAYINHQSPDKNTALMFAASNGNLEVVKLLTKRGANRFLMNKNNLTASMIADNYSHNEIKAYLNLEPQEENVVKDEKDSENIVISENKNVNLAGHTDAGYFSYDDEGLVDEPSKVVKTYTSDEVTSNYDYKPASTTRLKRLNKSNLPATKTLKKTKIASRLVMKDYVENEIPFSLKYVNENQKLAEIQRLYGDNEVYQVRFGELIPETEYRLQGGKHIYSSSKTVMNKEIDMSEVYLANLKDGKKYTLNKTNSGRSTEPYAVLEFKGNNALYDTRVNDKFYDITTEDDYEVINVRPNQILVKSMKSGEVFVIPKK